MLLANRILDDDLFIVVGARRTSVSFNPDMDAMPEFLQRYFSHNNLIVLYPEQFGQEVPLTSFVDPLATDISATPSALWLYLRGWYRAAIGVKKRLTHRNRRPKIDL